MKNSRGSLLIQLLISVGIIGLLAATSLPLLRQYQPQLKLNTATKQLTSDLRYAQQLTVTTQQIHYLEMDIINASYSVVPQDDPASPIKSVTLDPNINFQSITGLDNNRAVYNSYGAVVQAGVITLVNNLNKTKIIDIRPSGYVQIQ